MWNSKFLEFWLQVGTPCQGWPPYSGQTGETPWEGSGDHLALRALAPRSRRGQMCALAMCCHLISAVMPDHVLVISCFLFYLFFTKIKQTAEYCTVHLYSLYCYSCSVTSVQFVLFVIAYSTNVHQYTNKPVFKAIAVTWQVGNSIFKILLVV